MATIKVKVCPVCQHLNPPKVFECEICEADLATVRVSDREEDGIREPVPAGAPATREQRTAQMPMIPDRPTPPGGSFMNRVPDTRQEPVRQPAPAAGMARICEECGALNPPNGRKCEQCGEDISDIVPTPRAAEQPKKKYLLTSLDGAVTLPVREGETVLGREAELSGYLGSKMYVSRQHAKISLRNGKLTIENLKATNCTFVNNRSVDSRMVELKEGDEIGLGGNSVNGQRQELAAYFRVQAQ